MDGRDEGRGASNREGEEGETAKRRDAREGRMRTRTNALLMLTTLTLAAAAAADDEGGDPDKNGPKKGGRKATSADAAARFAQPRKGWLDGWMGGSAGIAGSKFAVAPAPPSFLLVTPQLPAHPTRVPPSVRSGSM